MTHMYEEVGTWNPFKGCHFDCIYCKPSFQAQAKRQKHNCIDCYHYRPHTHPERLNKIPSVGTIFVCGNGDISFCPIDYTKEIVAAIKRHNVKHPEKTYYLQTKDPQYFQHILDDLPNNIILLITLETNRDEGYREISKAPLPSQRWRDFHNLDYPRKVITIEPILDFDIDEFTEQIRAINPEYVWIGYNSRPKQVKLPEPEPAKVETFIRHLEAFTTVKRKEMRGTLS